MNSQAGQDAFVLSCLRHKRDGTFVEIGSHEPILINNTYVLESQYNWRGIMIEYEEKFLEAYQTHRPQSHHVIQDATTIDYAKLFEEAKMPSIIEYLQVDLEVNNQSTITVLEKLHSEVMDNHKFATVTFEHDIYTGDHFNTRSRSREIFESRGYVRVFSDVSNEGRPFEDWYVHPELVDMEYINSIKTDTSLEWSEIVKLL